MLKQEKTIERIVRINNEMKPQGKHRKKSYTSRVTIIKVKVTMPKELCPNYAKAPVTRVFSSRVSNSQLVDFKVAANSAKLSSCSKNKA